MDGTNHMNQRNPINLEDYDPEDLCINNLTDVTEYADWNVICDILTTHNFFEKEEKSKLSQLFEQLCTDQQVDWEDLKNDLCKAYDNINDDQFIFFDILSNQFNYSSNKRNDFYRILLFNYLKLIDLNKENIVDIFTNMFRKYDENIERYDVERIVENKNVAIEKSNWIKIHTFLKNELQYDDDNISNDTDNKSDIINKSLTGSSMDTQLKVQSAYKLTDKHLSSSSINDTLSGCDNQDIIIALKQHILPVMDIENNVLINQLQSKGSKHFLDELSSQYGIKKGFARSIWSALMKFDFNKLIRDNIIENKENKENKTRDSIPYNDISDDNDNICDTTQMLSIKSLATFKKRMTNLHHNLDQHLHNRYSDGEQYLYYKIFYRYYIYRILLIVWILIYIIGLLIYTKGY